MVTIFARWGKPQDALALYREAEARGMREYMQPAMLASAAAAVGEMELAIRSVRKAVDERDPLLVMLARSWSFYDELRGDPRLGAMIAELNFPR